MNPSPLSKSLVAGLLALGAFAFGGGDARGESGTASVYRGIPDNQIEQMTTPDRIRSVVVSGAPTAIWQALEHGEKVECLDCIPLVTRLILPDPGKPLLDPKSREIAAWWLRRRIFGVFGPGEAYAQITSALTKDADPRRRAAAAEALGEFLEAAGIAPVATALVSDAEPAVRAAAARALGRLNDPGPAGELSSALADADAGVRLAALESAGRVNAFSDVAAVAKLVSDPSDLVRRHAAAALGAMHAKDAVLGLTVLVKSDADARVRAEAAHSLGTIGDVAAKDALTAALSDPDGFVRDAASMALRRL